MAYSFRDRQKWIKDNRKQECKELLRSVSHTATLIHTYKATGEGKPEMSDAFLQSLKTFQSSIFIAQEIESKKLYEIWTTAVHEFTRGGDHKQFDGSIAKIRTNIIEMATK